MIMLFIIFQENSCMQLMHYHMLQAGRKEIKNFKVEAYVNYVTVPSIPATPLRLQVYKLAQIEECECSRIGEYCKTQWPGQHSMESSLKPYWKVRG